MYENNSQKIVLQNVIVTQCTYIILFLSGACIWARRVQLQREPIHLMTSPISRQASRTLKKITRYRRQLYVLSISLIHLIYDDRISAFITMTIASAIRNAILCNFIAFQLSKCKSIQMHFIATHYTYVTPPYNDINSNPRTSETPPKSINSETTPSCYVENSIRTNSIS